MSAGAAEKRKYIRLKAPLGVTYHILKKHKRPRPHKTLVKDVGGGGISLVVYEDLRAGDLLELGIQIPHLVEPVTAVGEVVWFVRTKGTDRELREAGLRFRDIKPMELRHILEYVHAVGIG